MSRSPPYRGCLPPHTQIYVITHITDKRGFVVFHIVDRLLKSRDDSTILPRFRRITLKSSLHHRHDAFHVVQHQLSKCRLRNTKRLHTTLSSGIYVDSRIVGMGDGVSESVASDSMYLTLKR